MLVRYKELKENIKQGGDKPNWLKLFLWRQLQANKIMQIVSSTLRIRANFTWYQIMPQSGTRKSMVSYATASQT